MSIDRPIAVFDSGLGGLTVAAEIQRQLPHEQLIFLADRARVPYASLSPSLITRFAGECAEFLLKSEPKLLVIACNTVSAVALDVVRKRAPVPVIGVIEPTAQAAARVTRTGRIGVLATTSTVKRRAYDSAFADLVPNSKVFSNGCPLLVPLVEEGWTEGEIPRKIVEHYAIPIRDEHVDTLVLGCTHYEYFRATLRDIFGPQVSLINTPDTTAKLVRTTLSESGQLSGSPETGTVCICSTDVNDALERVVEQLFAGLGETHLSIEAVEVPPHLSISRLQGTLSSD